MTVSEGVALFLAALFIGVLGWIGKRLVSSSDKTAESVNGINVQMATMNGRLNKTELVTEMHMREDDRIFKTLDASNKELWHAINAERDWRNTFIKTVEEQRLLLKANGGGT